MCLYVCICIAQLGTIGYNPNNPNMGSFQDL